MQILINQIMVIKLRSFDKILEEIEAFFLIHKKLDPFPGGIHLEITGQNVTECVGGEQEIKEENLSDRYLLIVILD